MRISTRILLSWGASLILILALAGWIFGYLTHQLQAEQAEQRIHAAWNQLNRHLDQHQQQIRQIATNLAQRREIRERLWLVSRYPRLGNELRAELDALSRELTRISGIMRPYQAGLYDVRGELQALSQQDVEHAQLLWGTRLPAGRFLVTEQQRSGATRAQVLEQPQDLPTQVPRRYRQVESYAAHGDILVARFEVPVEADWHEERRRAGQLLLDVRFDEQFLRQIERENGIQVSYRIEGAAAAQGPWSALQQSLCTRQGWLHPLRILLIHNAEGSGLIGTSSLQLEDGRRVLLSFVSSRDQVLGASREAFLRSALLSLALLFVLIFPAVYLMVRSQMVVPIRRLMGHIADLTPDADQQTVLPRTANEFALLQHRFDQMADAVRAREAALSRARDELEDRVKERTRALEAAMIQAQQANQAKSDFLSSISHELRTPLNAILGFAQVLGNARREPLGDRQRKQVDKIQRSGEHLLCLIDELLDLASIESGKLSIELEALNIGERVEQALSMVEQRAVERDIDLVLDLPADLPRVCADSTRVQQVLLNLLTNGIKYNRIGGQLQIGARVQGEQVCLSVCDTGEGLTPEQCEHLFEPFNRLGADERGIEGTGIGLAITRRLVEAMRGSILCRSQPGEGTCFEISLPLYSSRREEHG